jgi:hypothetical protein
MAAIFVTLAVFMASLSPDKFFAGLSSQNRVDSIIRALEVIDGTSCVDDKGMLAPLSHAMLGSGHCEDVSFIYRADSHTDDRGPSRDFTAPPARGTDTVARE